MEKVWGMLCDMMLVDWVVQWIKGFSLGSVVFDGFKCLFGLNKCFNDGMQVKMLFESFCYLWFGLGMMWDVVCDKILGYGNYILMGYVLK